VGGELLCVSPFNTIKTHIQYDASGNPTTISQEPGVCPSTFQPPKDNSLRSKLTFSFAIGQAF
jgi:hypothetical protein